jgi:ABC-type hemin transport system substrate-binding protein
VGDHQFSAEKILALRPTHILSISDRFGISKALAEQISARLIHLQLENLEDYPTALSRLGQIFKVEGAAQTLIQNWQRDWQQVNGQAKNKRVLLQVQQSPIVAVGAKTFLNRILETCGAKNALAAHNGYPKLNRETVYKLKPDQVVLILTHDLTNTQALKDLPAGTKVSHFEPDILSRLTPRLPMEAKKFCETL